MHSFPTVAYICMHTEKFNFYAFNKPGRIVKIAAVTVILSKLKFTGNEKYSNRIESLWYYLIVCTGLWGEFLFHTRSCVASIGLAGGNAVSGRLYRGGDRPHRKSLPRYQTPRSVVRKLDNLYHLQYMYTDQWFVRDKALCCFYVFYFLIKHWPFSST